MAIMRNELTHLLKNGKVTSVDLCKYCYALAVAGEEEWQLHAFERIQSLEDILQHAHEADIRRKEHKSLSLLDGIPISIKANIAVADQPLTAGSRILGGRDRDELENDPSPPAVGYSADVSRRLIEEGGAVLMGITAMDEFGMGSLGTNRYKYQENGEEVSRATKNPLCLVDRMGGKQSCSDEEVVKYLTQSFEAIMESHALCLKAGDDPHYSAGGSSCGGGASVAHGSSIASLGSDTGGSVRLPAAWCGVTGYKPSYGLLSRDGLVSYASSLDTIGVLAPSPNCSRIVLDHLQGTTPRRDSTTFVPNFSDSGSKKLEKGQLKGLKVGVPAAFRVEETPHTVLDAWLRSAETLELAGATIETVPVEEISPEMLKRTLAAYYVVATAEASSNLARYDGFRYGISSEEDTFANDKNGLSLLEQRFALSRTAGFGMEVTRRILCGTSALSSDRFHSFYQAAARLRAKLTKQVHGALSKYDIILVPTVLFPPPTVGQNVDQTEMLANDIMTVPFSMAGVPCVSVPFAPWDPKNCDLRPVRTAVQLVACRGNDDLLLQVASILDNSART